MGKSSRRWRAIAGFVTVGLGGAGTWVLPIHSVSATRGYHECVALGDSWSAATALVPLPTTEHVPFDCAQ